MEDLLLQESSRPSSRKRKPAPSPEVSSQGMRLSPDNNGISALLEAANIIEHSDHPTPVSLTAARYTETDNEQDAQRQFPLFFSAGWEEPGLHTTALSVESQDSTGERATAPDPGNTPGVITFSFPCELVDVRYSSERKTGPSVSQRLRDLYREALRVRLPSGKLVRLRI